MSQTTSTQLTGMRFWHVITILCVCLLPATLARADSWEDGTSPSLTENPMLADYLEYAALNNPGLRAAFHRWRAALEKIPQARALPDPKFTYAYFIREVETRVGPQEQKFGIAQKFPWFGKLRLRADAASKAAMVAQQKYEAAKWTLFHRVKSAYADYYYLSRATDTARENVALVKYLEEVVRTKYMAATAGHPDVIRAQVALGKLEDRLQALLDLRAAMAAKLNAALGRQADAHVPWPQNLQQEEILAKDAELLAWLIESSPELKALEFGIEKEAVSLRLAKKQYYPDITLGLDYIDTAGALMPGVADNGKDPMVVMVAINFPIWRSKYKASEREARARLQAARASRRDREKTLHFQAKLAIYELRDAGRKINLYRDTLLPKAIQSLKATETAYKGGTSDFPALLEAQRVLLEFQLSYERALADHVKRLARLEMLVGRDIPRGKKAPDPQPTHEGHGTEESNDGR